MRAYPDPATRTCHPLQLRKTEGTTPGPSRLGLLGLMVPHAIHWPSNLKLLPSLMATWNRRLRPNLVLMPYIGHHGRQLCAGVHRCRDVQARNRWVLRHGLHMLPLHSLLWLLPRICNVSRGNQWYRSRQLHRSRLDSQRGCARQWVLHYCLRYKRRTPPRSDRYLRSRLRGCLHLRWCRRRSLHPYTVRWTDPQLHQLLFDFLHITTVQTRHGILVSMINVIPHHLYGGLVHKNYPLPVHRTLFDE